jgi:TP901 family phage tail tape measure protein
MAVSVGAINASLALKDRFTRPLLAATKGLNKFGLAGQALGKVGKVFLATTGMIVAAAAIMVKSASDFESSFTGIRKTVDGTDEEFRQLAIGMRALSKEIPLSVDELNRIGESAGQLGVATGDILAFTETIAHLGVTTNLTTEAAATSLARMANIMDSELGPQFDRMGAAIVDLGNNLATTEAEIVEFGLRIAGAGKIAGLAEAQIFAIGGAMSSIGVRAQAGGTSVQKVLNRMTQSVANAGEELIVFADTAGLTTQQFADTFRDDAGEAFTLFVEGLKRQGSDAFQTLEDLSLQNERVIRSFIGLAQAGDLLRNSMALGEKAFSENIALVREAELRYSTFQSQMKILASVINDLAIAGGQILMPVLQAVMGDITHMATQASFTASAINAMTESFIFLVNILNLGVQAYHKVKQVWNIMLSVGAAFNAMILKTVRVMVTVLGAFTDMKFVGIDLTKTIDKLAEAENRMNFVQSHMTMELNASSRTAQKFGSSIDEVKQQLIDAKAGAIELSNATNSQRQAAAELTEENQALKTSMEEMNMRLDEQEGASIDAAAGMQVLKDAVHEVMDAWQGVALQDELSDIEAAYKRLTKTGAFTMKESRRMAEQLIGIREAGETIPPQFQHIVDSYERYVDETDRVDEANRRADESFRQFDLSSVKLQAEQLQATYIRLTEAGALNTFQTDQFGRAALALQEKLGTSLGPELDALAGRFAKTANEKIPSLREALGELSDGFVKVAQIAGGTFGGVMKKAGEAVSKIELVITSVDSLKTAFRRINDFFAGGGWNQITGAFKSD